VSLVLILHLRLHEILRQTQRPRLKMSLDPA